MRITYADLVHLSEQAEKTDRATGSAFVGFAVGLGLALLLWSGIGWLIVAAVH
jgi:hypothetical protein